MITRTPINITLYVLCLVKIVFDTLQENKIATIKVKVNVRVQLILEQARKAYGVAEVPTALLFLIFGTRWR